MPGRGVAIQDFNRLHFDFVLSHQIRNHVILVGVAGGTFWISVIDSPALNIIHECIFDVVFRHFQINYKSSRYLTGLSKLSDGVLSNVIWPNAPWCHANKHFGRGRWVAPPLVRDTRTSSVMPLRNRQLDIVSYHRRIKSRRLTIQIVQGFEAHWRWNLQLNCNSIARL